MFYMYIGTIFDNPTGYPVSGFADRISGKISIRCIPSFNKSFLFLVPFSSFCPFMLLFILF